MKRKLKLHRETLRYLEERDLQGSPAGQAGGGLTYPVCSVTCAFTCGNASTCASVFNTCRCA